MSATSPKKTKQILDESIFCPSKDGLGQRRFFTENDLDSHPLPNLIENQIQSFEWFISEGLKELLDEINPISDFSGKKLEIQFTSHEMGEPKYDPKTCRRKNLTYEAPLKVHVQLINKETGEIKEQDVFLGSIPLMTDKATFIVNGIERVVVTQIVRSPGVFFSQTMNSPYYGAKIIPKRGAWLEIETDKKGVLSVKVDRKRKIPVTSLLRVMGWETDEDIIKTFAGEIADDKENFILNTLEKDPAKTVDQAYQLIYKRIRPGDLATVENAKTAIQEMFFDSKKYDMGNVARYKINNKFGIDVENIKANHTFQKSDLELIIKEIFELNYGNSEPDDIDDLSNRRIRAVGEQVINKFRVGLLRTERIAKDRMTVMDAETVTPTQLVNSRPITAALREFFASSQLSQFMDQTNPLSELAHKRRISAMGPGGLTRERASFDVRDVHATHYGRICPITTPEGPNIGLVVQLATHAKIDEYGFLNSPYQVVKQTVNNKKEDLIGRSTSVDILDEKGKIVAEKGKVIDAKLAGKITKLKAKEITVKAYVTEEIERISADGDKKVVIAQAGIQTNELGEFEFKNVPARKHGEPVMAHIRDVTHIDIAPKQIISVSTSLIPFVEHNDSTRASMGSNMLRQAVPLVTPQRPVVGTGMEGVAGRNSSHVLLAEQNGQVSFVDASKIEVIYKNGKKISYELQNFGRSNEGTCLHQRPKVKSGQKISKGDILADGSSIDEGDLALGANLVTAYIPWEGYNFEDAVVISDRLVKDGVFDSIHIENYSIDIRDTKLGPEVVTKDIPNVGETKLKDLDENGIIRLGASVKEGAILVGKITPKGETELTAEERLLRAIFGDKARDVKDTSLKMPGGSYGKVVDIQIFDRKEGDELPTGVLRQIQVSIAQTRKIQIGDKVAGRHGNKGVISLIVPQEDMPYLPDGTPVDICLNPLGVVSRMNIGQILETHIGFAAHKLGIHVATPALNGIEYAKIQELYKKAGMDNDGKVQLFDGKTGEAYKHRTTVGISYILKLYHLVEDKIHARSIGPYSLVTQQPLGGKAQHGGQRFGEMEVWALEAYGAAHTLQEMITIKSDDIYGRSKAYEAIIKDERIKRPRTPESFNVLLKELQGLGLNVELINDSLAVDESADDFYTETEEDISSDVAKEIESETHETQEELQIDGQVEQDLESQLAEEIQNQLTDLDDQLN